MFTEASSRVVYGWGGSTNPTIWINVVLVFELGKNICLTNSWLIWKLRDVFGWGRTQRRLKQYNATSFFYHVLNFECKNKGNLAGIQGAWMSNHNQRNCTSDAGQPPARLSTNANTLWKYKSESYCELEKSWGKSRKNIGKKRQKKSEQKLEEKSEATFLLCPCMQGFTKI